MLSACHVSCSSAMIHVKRALELFRGLFPTGHMENSCLKIPVLVEIQRKKQVGVIEESVMSCFIPFMSETFGEHTYVYLHLSVYIFKSQNHMSTFIFKHYSFCC